MDIFGLIKTGTISFPRLLFHHYKSLGISDQQFLLILHLILFQEEGKKFPSITEIEERIGLTSTQIVKEMQGLLTKKLIELQQDVDQWGKMSEYYDLDPLFQKLVEIVEPNNQNREILVDPNLFSLFEREFGRPLSPREIEYLVQWLDQDQYQLDFIIAALNESKIVGKLNIRYIDRILLEWSQKQLNTVEEARAYSLQFRNKQFEQQQKKHHLSGKL